MEQFLDDEVNIEAIIMDLKEIIAILENKIKQKNGKEKRSDSLCD